MAQTKEMPSAEDMLRVTAWVREQVCSMVPAATCQSSRFGRDQFLDTDWDDLLSAALDEQARRDEQTIVVLRRQVRALRGRVAELEKKVTHATQMEADFLSAMHSIDAGNCAAIPDALWDWAATLEERASGTPPIASPSDDDEATGLPIEEALSELHRMVADSGG